MVISKLKLLLLLLIPVGAASAAGVYYVTVVNAVTPCEALKYNVSGQLILAQNTWNKPIEITGSLLNSSYYSPIQSITLQPGQSQLAYNFTGTTGTVTVTPTSGKEALNLENSAFASNGTEATLYIRNTGSGGTPPSPAHTDNYAIATTIVATNTVYTCQHSVQVYFPATIGTSIITSLITYYVKDTSGDTYAQTNWNGPSSTSNQLMTANIVIGSSCPTCTLSGTPFTFQSGNSYTIIIVTSRNNQFTFTVIR